MPAFTLPGEKELEFVSRIFSIVRLRTATQISAHWVLVPVTIQDGCRGLIAFAVAQGPVLLCPKLVDAVVRVKAEALAGGRFGGNEWASSNVG